MTALSLATVGIMHPLEETVMWNAATTAERIVEMSPERRLNLTLGLLAGSVAHARRFERYASWDARPCATITDPTGWITSMPVFRALITGLPRKRNPLTALAERARHLGGCAVTYGCGCDLGGPVDTAALKTISGLLGGAW